MAQHTGNTDADSLPSRSHSPFRIDACLSVHAMTIATIQH
jgi:hypothetical protein